MLHDHTHPGGMESVGGNPGVSGVPVGGPTNIGTYGNYPEGSTSGHEEYPQVRSFDYWQRVIRKIAEFSEFCMSYFQVWDCILGVSLILLIKPPRMFFFVGNFQEFDPPMDGSYGYLSDFLQNENEPPIIPQPMVTEYPLYGFATGSSSFGDTRNGKNTLNKIEKQK